MARKRRKRIASRGSVNNIILKTLVNGDKYGYEIIKEVEDFSNGKIQLKQPSLYSSLTRFEEKKFVSSYWGDSDIGGRRHYYHLTPEGLEYYKKFVLKETDNIDDEDVEEVLESNNIVLSNNSNNNQNEIDEEIEEEIDIEYEVSESITEDETMIIKEVDESQIPEIANFNNEALKQTEEVIADHQFHSLTPLENMIDNTNSTDNTTPSVNELSSCEDITVNSNSIDTNQNSAIDNEYDEYEQILHDLKDNAKISNKKFVDTPFKKLYINKPKKTKKIILDSDGIYKLRDEDYVPTIRRPDVIIDNVISRSNTNNDILGYATYSNSSKSHTTPIRELTEEERKQKNENFVAKFNLLTMSKIKPVSAPVQKPEPEIIDKKPEPKIDYRGKLNAIFENNNLFIEDEVIDDNSNTQNNNLYNYVDEDQWNTSSQTNKSYTENTQDSVQDIVEEDSFIKLDEEETFETKTNNTQYIEEINTYTTAPTSVKMTRYDNVTQAVLADKTYLLNNKLKLVFGIIMSLIMFAELTTLLFILKHCDLIHTNDKPILIGSYVIVGIFALVYILPYFVNSNSHKANNFKLKYSIWFGILTFLVSIILIYCFNALSGFEIDNFKYFATKLLTPITLVFNFIIGPVIYSLLLKNKSFYD